MDMRSQAPPAATAPPGAETERGEQAFRAAFAPRPALWPTLPVELEIAAEAGAPLQAIVEALERAPADGSPLQALIAEGAISEERYYQALAGRLGCAYYHGWPHFAADFDVARGLRSGVAPLAHSHGLAHAVIAPRPAVTPRLIEMILTGRLRPESFVLTSPQRFAALVRAQRPEAVLANALGRLPDGLSARRGFTGAQVAVIGLVGAAVLGLAAAGPEIVSTIASLALWILFLASIGVRSVASVAKPDNERPRLLSDDELPTYTVVAPLYRETEVVEQLIAGFDALDYPKNKLDIKLVVERRDHETLARLVALNLPARYEVVVAPPGEPSTKPRALNIALAEARGEFLVVYDAEDIPAPGQLRLAASRFAADRAVDCLQARLTVRNIDDSWYARLFSLEYAALFDLINPGLCALGLPITLGGTSNHFRVSSLVDVGGWDEWNVAEDADLGVRLARYGYAVGALESDTSEEAPNAFRNWFKQRVRWQKGWMQTCIVHSRAPIRFVRDLGPRRAFFAMVLIFGAVASALLWPGFALTTLWRALGPTEGELSRWREGVDVFVYLLSFAGVWAVLMPAVVASRRRRLKVGLAEFASLPLYYGLVSLAAWTAILDLVFRPHFWAKTDHGLAGRPPDGAGAPR